MATLALRSSNDFFPSDDFPSRGEFPPCGEFPPGSLFWTRLSSSAPLSPSDFSPPSLPILSLSFSLDDHESSTREEKLAKIRDVVKAKTPGFAPRFPLEKPAPTLREKFASLPFHQAERSLCLTGSSWMHLEKNLYPTNFWAPDATLAKLPASVAYYNGNEVTVVKTNGNEVTVVKTNGNEVTVVKTNGNEVTVASDRKLIVCQGTKKSENVEEDFWRMVYHNRSPAILMLTRLFEGGKQKCSKYFPDVGETKEWPASSSITKDEVKVQSTNAITYGDSPGFLDISTFELSVGGGEPHTVHHLWYRGWKDFGVPDFDEFSRVLESFLEAMGGNPNPGVVPIMNGPAVVHCSAGLGRSGCAVLAIKILENEGTDPIELLREMRTERHGVVQTFEQFEFACRFRDQ